jgi:hypothetical protein
MMTVETGLVGIFWASYKGRWGSARDVVSPVLQAHRVHTVDRMCCCAIIGRQGLL